MQSKLFRSIDSQNQHQAGSSICSHSRSNNSSLFKKARQADTSPDSIKQGLGLRGNLNVLQAQLVNLCDITDDAMGERLPTVESPKPFENGRMDSQSTEKYDDQQQSLSPTF